MLKTPLKALAIYFNKPVSVGWYLGECQAGGARRPGYLLLCASGRQDQSELGRCSRNHSYDLREAGIPEAEQKFLAGVGAQYESESVYHSLRTEWEKLGVVFLDMDTALRERPEIVKEYFGHDHSRRRQ
jgi:Fe-S cluster assembly protein SufB